MDEKEVDFQAFLGATATFKSKRWGVMTVESASFTSAVDGDLVVYFGKPLDHPSPLVRIHSECIFAEILNSNLCDCSEQLDITLNRFKREKNGILFYLRLDGRGAGLSAKVKATDLENQGLDTYDSRIRIGVPPEGRDFSRIGSFLNAKGIRSVRLLTNNPDKIQGIASHGIKVNSESLVVQSSNPNIHKLYKTKAKRFNHSIPKDILSLSDTEQLTFDFSQE